MTENRRQEQLKRKEFLSTGQAAELCSVTADTVLKWIKSNRLPANRTAGGHYRIHREALQNLIDSESSIDSVDTPSAFKFCWEYYNDGQLSGDCQKCIVFKSRAKRCYEINRVESDLGHTRKFCQGTCDECEYFRVVQGQKLNIMVITESGRLQEQLEDLSRDLECNLRFSANSYHCSMIVERFRPDYVVIDSLIGIDSCHQLTKALSEDPRIPFVKIIVVGNLDNIPEECNRRVFAFINSPFESGDIGKLIEDSRK